MKLEYFRQAAPDADDRLLAEAIARGEVPTGCLFGGGVASSLVAVGRKPCHSCAGPRARCGGEPREDGDDDRAAAIDSLREAVGESGPIKDLQDFLKARRSQ